MTTAAEKPLVLVTRPQPGAGETASRLAAIGCRPAVLPLTRVAPIPISEDPGLASQVDAVVMTSGNAVRHAPDWLVERVSGKPAFTVGAATMAEAMERGFLDVRTADGDVLDLVGLLSRAAKPGWRFLYLCGRMRTGNLEQALSKIGMKTRVLEVYRTEKVSRLTYEFQRIAGNAPIWGALFHSAFSARVFNSELAGFPGKSFENTLFFAISERVATNLRSKCKNEVRVAERPTEDALMASVEWAMTEMRN